MSQRTVERWSTATNTVAAAAGAVLRRLKSGGPAAQATGPSRLAPTPLRILSTMAATGHVAFRAAHATPRHAEEQDMLAPLLPTTGRGRRDEKWWHAGWLHCRYDAEALSLGMLRQVQHRIHGAFNLQALLAAPACGDEILYHATGSAVTRADFPLLVSTDQAIGDVLQVEWVSPRHLRFRCRRHDWPLHPKLADQFRRYCDTIVHNYPALLLPQNAPDEFQPRPPTESGWYFRTEADARILVHELVVAVNVDLGPVQTMADAARLARQHDDVIVRFDPHPLLDEYAPIWTDSSPPRTRHQRHTPSQARAVQEVAGRARQAIEKDATLGEALATVSWGDIMRLPATASGQRLLFHKIKGIRLSGWDRSKNQRGCPHCPPAADTDTGHTFHIMWHCTAAQALWIEFRSGWERIGVIFATTADFSTAVFSLRLRHTPPSVWAFLGVTGVDPDLVPLRHSSPSVPQNNRFGGCFSASKVSNSPQSLQIQALRRRAKEPISTSSSLTAALEATLAPAAPAPSSSVSMPSADTHSSCWQRQ